MRNRQEIEKNIESTYRDDEGDMQYIHANSEELQVLILEVLLDIRRLLSQLI